MEEIVDVIQFLVIQQTLLLLTVAVAEEDQEDLLEDVDYQVVLVEQVQELNQQVQQLKEIFQVFHVQVLVILVEDHYLLTLC